GAAGTVTGSSYWLMDSDNKGILVDLGLFQGVEEPKIFDNERLYFEARDLTGVVLTHAHLDHCGRLPLLVQAGYTGPIYMTEATRQLLELSLFDSAKVMAESEQRRGERKALFSEEEVEKLLLLCRVVHYDKSFTVGNFEITLRDAGHILGSASVEVVDKREGFGPKKIVFSGDLGNTPQDLIRPTTPIIEAELVVMESTYGDRTHGGEDAVKVLTEEINAVEASGGTLLIPAFSLERTQEILHKIDHLKKNKLVRDETLVFLDSPMAIKATMIFKHFPELYNEELSGHAKTDDPFDFPGLVLVEKGAESAKIHEIERAKVIIAGSGMMAGGRILHHAAEFLPLTTTRLLQVGFQAVGTIGRRILDGEKKVRIYDAEVEVAANIRNVSTMSAHADQPRLMRWLGQIKGVKRVFLTHGEELPRLVLSEKIKNDLGMTNVVLPKMNQAMELG
ncbi:MAG: MBL fold metallo-hydrolase, partial [Patescibacteria group bacterium]